MTMCAGRVHQTPHDSEGVATFAGADESALFQRLNRIAIGRKGADYFVVFQSAQNRVAAERISFKPVSVLDVRQEVLFTLREFRRDNGSTGSFLLRQFSRPYGTLFW